MKAMRTTAPDIPHFFCFRHLMENFHKKYKSKVLKIFAWILARSRTKLEYERVAAKISLLDNTALSWLQDVGREKWSTAFSPCPRFNTSTSNNVKSVNSALKEIHSLPIIDCLLGIERYVACKRAANAQKVKRWGILTPYASRKVDKLMATDCLCEVDACLQSSFIVAIRPGVGNHMAKPLVQFFDKLYDARAVTSKTLARLAFMHYLH